MSVRTIADTIIKLPDIFLGKLLSSIMYKKGKLTNYNYFSDFKTTDLTKLILYIFVEER